MSAEARSVTCRAFLATLVLLAVEVAIGIVAWTFEPWHTFVMVAGFTTYLFVALFGVALAGERWSALGTFTQLHSWVVVAVVMGSAAAMLFYVVYPDPVMLLLGPFVLGVFVLLGLGMQKVHLFGF